VAGDESILQIVAIYVHKYPEGLLLTYFPVRVFINENITVYTQREQSGRR
jgi:hypothetical protein